tara:strand:+ start:966 stop:2084 length:1119 start_codon:yes stop_codon:yes gene_type:complete
MNNYKYFFQIFILIKVIIFYAIYYIYSSKNFGDVEQFYILRQGSISDYLFNLKIWYYDQILDLKTNLNVEYEFKNLKPKVFTVQLITQYFYKLFSYNYIITNLFFYFLFSFISFQFIFYLKNKIDILIFFIISFSVSGIFYSSFPSKELFFNIFLMLNILNLHSKINIKFKVIFFIPLIVLMLTLRFEIALIYIFLEIIYFSYKKNLINRTSSTIIFYSLCFIILYLFISKYLIQLDFLISNRYRTVFYGSEAASNLWNLNNHNSLNFMINFFWGFFSNYTSFLIDSQNTSIENLVILNGTIIFLIQLYILFRLFKLYRFKYFILFFFFFALLHIIIFFVAPYNLGHKARIFNNIYYLVMLYPLLIINKSKN